MARLVRWIPSGPPPAPPAGWLGRSGPSVREGLVVWCMFLAATQVLVENPAVRRLAKVTQPRFAQAWVSYLQLFQGWAMFAPDAPLGDMNVFVEAVTADGRKVDPFSEAAGPRYPAPGPRVPPRLDQSSFFCDYLTRIERRRSYHQALLEWLLAYPDRTGRDQDRIVSLRAFVVEDDSPPPGEREPRNVRVRPFLEWEAPR